MMTNNFEPKESIAAATNGLGCVVIQLHGESKTIHLTVDETRVLARQLTEMATDAEWQNSVL